MMQDDEVTQPAPEPTSQPGENTETKSDLPAEASAEAGETGAAAAAPAAEAMPEQPSPAPVESPEAVASVPEEMAPPPSAPAPQVSQPDSVQPNLSELRSRANAKRTARREEHLQHILSFASTNPSFSNQNVRDLLHVSQSSASTYLSELVKQEKLKKEGRARAARYSL